MASATTTAIEIEDGLGEGEGEGRVTDVHGTCPNITITVDGLTVKADALTRYIPEGGVPHAISSASVQLIRRQLPARFGRQGTSLRR